MQGAGLVFDSQAADIDERAVEEHELLVRLERGHVLHGDGREALHEVALELLGAANPTGAEISEDVAAALAYRRGASVLVGGMCETDYSGFPDCRDITLKALQVALSLGLDTPMTVETPLMWLDKAQTWGFSAALGGEALNALIVEHTHTCYLGDRSQRHDWGYGCGQCPACALRARGFHAWRQHGNAPFADTMQSDSTLDSTL